MMLIVHPNMNERSAGQNILLIDDDELIAGSLRHYLSTQGCAADVAVDATSGEALMRANAYSVVVVDPYLTARVRSEEHAVIDTIRALQPGAAVIVLTAYASSALLRLADDGHVNAVVSKPQPVIALGQRILQCGHSPIVRSQENQ
jgi:DNA-binding NarL/FixJ family response regulator